MKDNMVQELLLKALLAQRPNAFMPQANNNQRQTTSLNNMQLGQRESLETLLKSLYLNNATEQQDSNINNANNKQILNMPQTSAPAAQKTGAAPQNAQTRPAVFEEFLNQEPDFFKGREVLFEYLNSLGSNFDAQELQTIAAITKQMEEDAIKRFCAKNPKYAQFLQQENSRFLNKLESAAGGALDGSLKSRPYYSVSDVMSMSTDEFLKHEDEIDAQIAELIKKS